MAAKPRVPAAAGSKAVPAASAAEAAGAEVVVAEVAEAEVAVAEAVVAEAGVAEAAADGSTGPKEGGRVRFSTEFSTTQIGSGGGTMLPRNWIQKAFRLGVVVATLSLGAAFCLDGAWAAQAKGKEQQRVFASPEDAVKALIEAGKSDDSAALMKIFGPESKDAVGSGDPVADRENRKAFVAAYEEANKLVREGDAKAVLQVGKEDWPFPIPIVKQGESWRFDTKAGKEEILNRRIGKNELSVIQVCLAYVDAQREYATKDRNKDGLLEYAQKFRSSPGKKDGLYWEAKEGEPSSPLGPLAAQAVKAGYKTESQGQPTPYHGYYFKILTGQGKNARGGAYDYVVKGKMMGGFALVAWPAKYASSGVVTFIVNHDGVVYEKDLGPKTASVASGMTKFDADSSWKKIEAK